MNLNKCTHIFTYALIFTYTFAHIQTYTHAKTHIYTYTELLVNPRIHSCGSRVDWSWKCGLQYMIPGWQYRNIDIYHRMITQISSSSRELTDIEHIKRYIHIRYAIISRNFIKNISSLGSLCNLITLRADHNSLTNIVLDELPYLQNVNFNDNLIHSMEGIVHPMLERLSMASEYQIVNPLIIRGWPTDMDCLFTAQKSSIGGTPTGCHLDLEQVHTKMKVILTISF